MKKIIALIIMIPLFMILAACEEEESHDPLGTLYDYMDAYESMDFEKMYDLLDAGSRETMTREEYLTIYEGIYNSIPITDAKMESRMEPFDMERKVSGEESTRIPMNLIMTVQEEEIRYSTDVRVIREEDEDGNDNYKVAFSPDLDYQNFKKTDKVETREVGPLRGEIFDRNMKPIAINGEVLWVGMVPGDLGTRKAAAIKAMADTFSLTEEYINRRLGLSWVRDNTFVDMLKVSMDDKSRVDALISQYPGIIYRVVKDRVYPYKAAAAHLTGYLGLVSAEEYKELEPLGFPIDTRVGRAGLELLYEEEMRGQKGTEMVLVDEDGNVKEVLSSFKNNKGKDLILTIDIEKQAELFRRMNGEMGAASVVNYDTGEVEALVSSPSYDPNQFILGHSNASYNAVLNDPKNPLMNRFTKRYVPGSTIKPLTAAIAMETEGFDEEKVIEISGKQWQADPSWGNYSVTRVTDPGVPVDIEKAFIYSDNIFFAQMALDMGSEAFMEGMQKFGVGEDNQLGFGFENSQLTNDGAMASDVLLADSGYGQGQVLFHSLTLPKAYTAIADGGVMKELKLFMDEESSAEKSVINEETADKVLGYLEKTISDPNGTGHEAYIEGRTLAGKTGTSEIGQGRNRSEIGWFSVIDQDPAKPFITTVMVEKVEGRGGSAVAVRMARDFITTYGQQ